LVGGGEVGDGGLGVLVGVGEGGLGVLVGGGEVGDGGLGVLVDGLVGVFTNVGGKGVGDGGFVWTGVGVAVNVEGRSVIVGTRGCVAVAVGLLGFSRVAVGGNK
jgi:hypothetical protein